VTVASLLTCIITKKEQHMAKFVVWSNITGDINTLIFERVRLLSTTETLASKME